MRIMNASILLLLGLAGSAIAAPAPLFVKTDTGSARERLFMIFQGGAGTLDPGIQGAAGVLNHILAEGPARLTATEYKKQLFLLNSEVSYLTMPRATIVSIAAVPEKLAETLQLVAETIRAPKLDEENFAKAQGKTANAVAQREDSMSSTLRYFAMRDAFDYHPDVRNGATSQLGLKKVDLNVVKAQWPVLFNSEALMFGAAGPLGEAELRASIDAVMKKNGFQDKPYKAPVFKNASFKPGKSQAGRITILNKPQAVDNQVLLLTRRDLPRDNADMLAFDLANASLGEGSTGALALTLREERGLTYYAGSGEDFNLGYWVVASFASTDKVAPLMKGLEEVVKRQSHLKLDDKGVEILKNQQLRSWKEGRELPMDELQIITEATLYGRNVEFQNNFDKEIAKVSADAVNRSGQKNFSLRDTRVYLMGDKDKLIPIVKKLGYKDIRVVETGTVL